MNQAFRLTLFLIVLVLTSGCAHFTAMSSDVLKVIKSYEAEREYGKALDLIALTGPDHPQRAQLMRKKAQLEAKARSFEQTNIRRAGELVARNRWDDAIEVYRNALDKLPKSSALRADLREFRRRQAQRVEELEVDQLITRARWLERSLPVQKAIVTTDSGSDASDELDSLIEEAREVAKELSRIGLAALARNNLALAGRTLPIASRLNPNSEAKDARNQLSRKESAKNGGRSNLDKLRRKEIRKLLADFRQAFRAGDLRRSRLIMTRLQDVDGHNPEVIEKAASLKAELNAAIKNYMSQGASLYGRGKFVQAVASWKRVLEIDPDNELARSSLERAERVMDKLKQLRDQQTSNRKP